MALLAAIWVGGSIDSWATGDASVRLGVEGIEEEYREFIAEGGWHVEVSGDGVSGGIIAMVIAGSERGGFGEPHAGHLNLEALFDADGGVERAGDSLDFEATRFGAVTDGFTEIPGHVACLGGDEVAAIDCRGEAGHGFEGEGVEFVAGGVAGGRDGAIEGASRFEHGGCVALTGDNHTKRSEFLFRVRFSSRNNCTSFTGGATSKGVWAEIFSQ